MQKPSPIEITPPQRSIPANIQAEIAFLGSLMLDPDGMQHIEGTVTKDDLFRLNHQLIFDAMVAVHESQSPIDFVTLTEELERRGQLQDIGGPGVLTGLVANTPTSLYLEHYAGIIRDLSLRRKLIGITGKIGGLAYDETIPVSAAIEQTEQMIFNLDTTTRQSIAKDARTITTAVVDRIDYLSKHAGELHGVPTGLSMLDRILGGFQEQDLIILAARPGMGKSSFAMTAARNAMRRGKRIHLVSLEMSAEQFGQRLLAMESGIDTHRMRHGKIHEDEWPILLEAANTISRYGWTINDGAAGSMPVQQVGAAGSMTGQLRRSFHKQPFDLLIIDYLQLIAGTKAENRNLEVAAITGAFKSLAKELNIPILLLSQLNRSVESRANKRPILSDLRDSGAIEQDADVILFIYRDDYYNEESTEPNIAEVDVAKHRNGATGRVKLLFRKELTEFRDVEFQRTDLPGVDY